MKHETIRRIEIFLGKPLCALLTLVRRVSDRLRDTTDEPPRRILFLKLIEQGATVLAIDAVRIAAERTGRENIYFCVFSENRAILDVLDLVPAQNIFVIRSESFASFVSDVLRVLGCIRRARIDAVVDMELFSRATAILAFLSGARMRAGVHRFTAELPFRGDLLTHRVQHNPFLHMSQLYRLLVEALWMNPSDPPLMKCPPSPPPMLPSFVPGEDETARVRAKLNTLAGGTVDGPLVLLNPNPGDLLPLRRWPEARFIELASRLLAERPDVTVVLTGAPVEQTSVEMMREKLGTRALCMAGHTTLREMFVLYTLADVLVTNDSGPGHFASLTGIDCIVLFGPETPTVFGPLGARSQSVSAGLACSPCFNAYNHRLSPCLYNACMHAITVDQVLARVREALSARVTLGAAKQVVA